MELYQIRYFLAVAEALNFTRAAERLFVSQPALTKAIQRLEEAIGGRLFDRTKNAVQLTELGHAMLPNFRQIFESSVHAREHAKRLMQEQQHVVRVGVMCTIDLQQVLPAFAGCSHSHPGIELSFRDGSHEGLHDALAQNEIDMGIWCSPHDIAKRFTAITLYQEEYVLAIGDDHRFNGRTSIEMAELNRERYCDRLECEFSSHIERLLNGRGVFLEVVQRSSREDWIRAFVRANFGVAFMPLSIARSARLAHVRIADAAIMRTVSVVVPADPTLPASLQTVVDALRGHNWQLAPMAA